MLSHAAIENGSDIVNLFDFYEHDDDTSKHDDDTWHNHIFLLLFSVLNLNK